MAWTTFETLNAYRRSDYAAELFYASAHLNGHVQALTEVSKLIYAPNANDDDASRAQKSKNAATLTSRDYAIYEQALRGVLIVAAEKKQELMSRRSSTNNEQYWVIRWLQT
ncbi:hypothetical protein VI618_15215 [Klebsiella pneumoniae]|uniref:hypothetical protein n=1 Tax=Klebsiella pneumoniae TaxID=573 RepID=UPI002D782E27|nr:hypothetical protein [Klebsiella pneumoniae]WRT33745.1 hypothetical protein VI618_15215 [Klebsiella pneumoniae]